MWGGTKSAHIVANNGSITQYSDKIITNPSGLGFTSKVDGTFTFFSTQYYSTNPEYWIRFFVNGAQKAQPTLQYGQFQKTVLNINKGDVITFTCSYTQALTRISYDLMVDIS